MRLWLTLFSVRAPIEFHLKPFAAQRCALLRTTIDHPSPRSRPLAQHSLADGRCWPKGVALQLTAAFRTVNHSDFVMQTAAAACIKHRLNGRIVAYERVCHCTVRPQNSFRPPRRLCSWSGHWVPEATCIAGKVSRPASDVLNGQRCLVPVPALPPVSYCDY